MRLITSLAILFLGSSFGWANIGPQGFKAHLNPHFVETGTLYGDGIWQALRDGFPEIHSVEFDLGWVTQAREKFSEHPNVYVWHKDSGKQLYEVIKNIDGQITFWLDAHNGWNNPIDGKNTPLLAELDQIKLHKIKTHTIMIDDMHCCNTVLFDYLTIEQISAKVLEINPAYQISFEPGGNGGEYPKNVLVATVPAAD